MNKQKTKQGNLYHLDHNKESIGTIMYYNNNNNNNNNKWCSYNSCF
jgi:hypothetical protein